MRAAGSKDAIADPGLSPGFGDDPPGKSCPEPDPPATRREPQIPAGLEQPAAPPEPCTAQPGRDHKEADADHDAERKKGRRDRRPVLRRGALPPRKPPPPITREAQPGHQPDHSP